MNPRPVAQPAQEQPGRVGRGRSAAGMLSRCLQPTGRRGHEQGSRRWPADRCGRRVRPAGAVPDAGCAGGLGAGRVADPGRGWLRTARISGRPAAQRDWRLWTAAALTAAAVALLALGVGLLSAAIAAGHLVGWLLGLLIVLAGGLGGIAAVGAVQARYRQGPVEAELSTQIRREQHLARELDLLRPLGWTVLHDRLGRVSELMR